VHTCNSLIFRRRTALPPILLLGEEFDEIGYADDVYDDAKLLKTLKGFSG
jgi:hypothetical protein